MFLKRAKEGYSLKYLLVCTALTFSGAAFSEPSTSGNDLYAACKTAPDHPLQAFCTGYVMGYVDGRNWGTFIAVNRLELAESAQDANTLGNKLAGHCVPENATNGQLVDVAKKYLEEHPEQRHESARTLIWLSFLNAFPCE